MTTNQRTTITAIDRVTVHYVDVTPLDSGPVSPLVTSATVDGLLYTPGGNQVTIGGEMTRDETSELADLLKRVGTRLEADVRRSLEGSV